MKKTLRIIILIISGVGFISTWLKTGSFLWSLIALGVGLVWITVENFLTFGNIEENAINSDEYKKEKESLKKRSKNNSTLR